MLRRAFPGDRRGLTRYLGFYLSHFHSFSWSGYVLRSLICVHEQDGMICSTTVERNRDPVDGALYRSKYHGYLSLLGNRIFVPEFESLARDAIVETVLYPAGRSQLTLLRGVTFGISSKQRNPYVSRVVWKFLGTTVDYRAALKATGLISIENNALDPAILRIIGDRPLSERLAALRSRAEDRAEFKVTSRLLVVAASGEVPPSKPCAFGSLRSDSVSPKGNYGSQATVSFAFRHDRRRQYSHCFGPRFRTKAHNFCEAGRRRSEMHVERFHLRRETPQVEKRYAAPVRGASITRSVQ